MPIKGRRTNHQIQLVTNCLLPTYVAKEVMQCIKLPKEPVSAAIKMNLYLTLMKSGGNQKNLIWTELSFVIGKI